MKLPDHPFFIQFFPTFACNNNCGFCFNRGLEVSSEATFHDCKRVIEKIAGLGIREIDILGGEPTLHPDILWLVRLAARRGMRVFLSSNGSNVGVLERLSEEFGKDILTIGVSINSAVIPDRLREYILKYRPVLKGICAKDSTVPDAARDFIDAGFKYYMLFMDILSADDRKGSLTFPEFFSRLNALDKEHKNVEGVYCSGFIPDNDDQLLSRVRCPAGVTKLSIMPDGSVYPCYLFFRHPEYRLGNILTDDFEAIWSNSILDFFRRFETNNCPVTDCELLPSCHGGCPAVSLLLYNDLRAPDPRCFKK